MPVPRMSAAHEMDPPVTVCARELSVVAPSELEILICPEFPLRAATNKSELQDKTSLEIIVFMISLVPA